MNMKIENLLHVIIGLANGAKMNNRVAQLNSIIALCELALESLDEQNIKE